MSLVAQLVGFGLRQVIGDFADSSVQVVAAVEQHFRDHSRTLPKALDQAHNRAWQALGVALAGDGLLDRVKVFFASGDDKGVREQVQLFLKSNAVSFDGAPADFRRDCLDELKRLRKSGMLSTTGGSSADIARQAASFKRHADPQGLVEESRRAVAGVADALAEGYPNLSRLLRAPTPAGPPLLAAAFCYFFRREVETDDSSAHGLFFDGLRQLSASQARAFAAGGRGAWPDARRTSSTPFSSNWTGLKWRSLRRTPSRSRRTGRFWTLQAELRTPLGRTASWPTPARSATAAASRCLDLAQAGNGMQAAARCKSGEQDSFSIRGEDRRQAGESVAGAVPPAASRGATPGAGPAQRPGQVAGRRRRFRGGPANLPPRSSAAVRRPSGQGRGKRRSTPTRAAAGGEAMGRRPGGLTAAGGFSRPAAVRPVPDLHR